MPKRRIVLSQSRIRSKLRSLIQDNFIVRRYTHREGPIQEPIPDADVDQVLSQLPSLSPRPLGGSNGLIDRAYGTRAELEIRIDRAYGRILALQMKGEEDRASRELLHLCSIMDRAIDALDAVAPENSP